MRILSLKKKIIKVISLILISSQIISCADEFALDSNNIDKSGPESPVSGEFVNNSDGGSMDKYFNDEDDILPMDQQNECQNERSPFICKIHSVLFKGSLKAEPYFGSWLMKLKKKQKRNLIQYPVIKGNPTRGACGSRHYNAETYNRNYCNGCVKRETVIDNWIDPSIACHLMQLTEKWHKKQNIRINPGATISYGDISHPFYVDNKELDENGNTVWHHGSHTKGLCVDFRPMKKNRYYEADKPCDSRQECYDKEKTHEFIKFIKDQGFIDKTSISRRPYLFFCDQGDTVNESIKKDGKVSHVCVKGHFDHIHVCFSKIPKRKSPCHTYKPDREICPHVKVDDIQKAI